MKVSDISAGLWRMFALALAFFSLVEARSGFYESQSTAEINRRNYLKSAQFSFEGLKAAPSDIRLLYLNTTSSFLLAERNNDEAAADQAARSAKKLITENPRYSRGWIYSALTRVRQGEDFAKVKKELERGVSLEPHGAWVLNTVAKTYLKYWPELSDAEKRQCVERFRRSLAMHDTNQASSYLDESLSSIWNATQSFDLLLQIVPADIFSYDRLLLLTERKGLWKYRAPLFKTAQGLRRKTYEEQCRKAERQLLNGYRDRAFTEFQIASWIDNTRIYAEAGMLVSGYPRRFWPFNVSAVLQSILEDNEEEWDFLMPRLAQVIEQQGSVELKLRYEKKLQQAQKASGQAPLTQPYDENLWWNPKKGNVSRLKYEESLGMPLTLRNGHSRISIQVKSQRPDAGEYAYLRFRLLTEKRGKIIGEIYADFEGEKVFSFEVDSSGGKKWLQAEILNRDNGANLDLGTVKIVTSR